MRAEWRKGRSTAKNRSMYSWKNGSAETTRRRQESWGSNRKLYNPEKGEGDGGIEFDSPFSFMFRNVGLWPHSPVLVEYAT